MVPVVPCYGWRHIDYAPTGYSACNQISFSKILIFTRSLFLHWQHYHETLSIIHYNIILGGLVENAVLFVVGNCYNW